MGVETQSKQESLRGPSLKETTYYTQLMVGERREERGEREREEREREFFFFGDL